MTDRSSAPRSAAPPPRGARRIPSVLIALPSLAAAVLAAAVLAACTSGGASSGPAAPTPGGRPLVLTASGAPADTLRQPMEITSGPNHVLSATVAAVFKTLNVPGKGPMTLRTYQVLEANGVDYSDSAKYGFPGPTFRAYPGDSIHIVLMNQMWDTTTAGGNPSSDTTQTACASYPAHADSVDVYEDCFHGINWTNIHYHGMHVTPASNGDDVLLLIPPDSTYVYGFRIPGNQSAGTHWYHPHKHGSVAIQVLNGMSGALVVDGGPLDTLTDAHNITEKLIALQQIDTLPNLMTTNVFGQYFLVNGQQTPVIVMAPGEVQRWRIVNENVTKTNNFQIAIADSAGTEPTLYEIARDGVAYADTNYSPNGGPEADTNVLMSPGNRLDLYVQAPQNAGIFSVHARPVAHDVPQDQTRKRRQGRLQANAPAGSAELAAVAAAGAQNPPLFYVQVDNSLPPTTSSLPSALPALPWFLANLPGSLDTAQILDDPSKIAVVVFSDSGFGAQTHSRPAKFYLGTWQDQRMQFNSSRMYIPLSMGGDSLPMLLDSVQTWVVMNKSTATNHPFHIHINPFQVIDVVYPQGEADPNADLYAELKAAAQSRGAPIWLDVVPLPAPVVDTTSTSPLTIDTIPGYVVIRQAYQPFLNADQTPCTNCGPAYGSFVMHCHILGHEERGMMQVIAIYQNAGDVPGPGAAADAGHGSHGAHGGHAPSPARPAPGSGRGGGRGSGNGTGHQH
jgi:L-ascorbate oxidase